MCMEEEWGNDNLFNNIMNEAGEDYVVQIIIDNEKTLKATGQKFMVDHIYIGLHAQLIGESRNGDNLHL
ncbi:hypothetical protein Lal_00027141 [Lupinus albus]|nr:hypothetical protein Lal_00027141 [Lupinus albus]